MPIKTYLRVFRCATGKLARFHRITKSCPGHSLMTPIGRCIDHAISHQLHPEPKADRPSVESINSAIIVKMCHDLLSFPERAQSMSATCRLRGTFFPFDTI
jgi:hypothetical protein